MEPAASLSSVTLSSSASRTYRISSQNIKQTYRDLIGTSLSITKRKEVEEKARSEGLHSPYDFGEATCSYCPRVITYTCSWVSLGAKRYLRPKRRLKSTTNWLKRENRQRIRAAFTCLYAWLNDSRVVRAQTAHAFIVYHLEQKQQAKTTMQHHPGGWPPFRGSKASGNEANPVVGFVLAATGAGHCASDSLGPACLCNKNKLRATAACLF